jgi:hypothetical protein
MATSITALYYEPTLTLGCKWHILEDNWSNMAIIMKLIITEWCMSIDVIFCTGTNVSKTLNK